jgi:hypothetical protein
VNCLWGAGDVPIKPVLALLRDKKYPIPAFIEYEYRGAGSAEAELKKCFQYCIEALLRRWRSVGEPAAGAVPQGTQYHPSHSI